MRKIKMTSGIVLLVGYVCIAFALVIFIIDHVARFVYSYPYDRAIAFGGSDLVGIGILALAAGSCLKNLETRVGRIEDRQLSTSNEKVSQ